MHIQKRHYTLWELWHRSHPVYKLVLGCLTGVIVFGIVKLWVLFTLSLLFVLFFLGIVIEWYRVTS